MGADCGALPLLLLLTDAPLASAVATLTVVVTCSTITF